MLKTSAQEKTNLFFGVCPRFGQKHYDLTWQIRSVRALWSDIDHCSVDEALARTKIVGLPEPSIVVNSDNGVHLYWLLNAPYAIDDAPEPPKVLTRFLDVDGKKKPEKYFLDAQGNEVLVSNRHLCPPLSLKAQHVQDILAGLAAKLRGDHTTDLSRLLRLPGSLNRKNERNGAEPRATELVVCDGTRRYSLQDFGYLAAASPSAERREQLKHVQLPAKRSLTATQKDTLNAAILRCAIESKGGRSIKLSELARSIHDFLAANAHKLAVDDPLLQGASSPALEAYRKERAALAKLERLERERQLLPRDDVRQALGRISAILRAAGDTLQREFGQEALEILAEALSDAEREVESTFGDHCEEDQDGTGQPPAPQ